VSWWAYTGAVR